MQIGSHANRSISGSINSKSNDANQGKSSRRRQRTVNKSYGSVAAVHSVTENSDEESSVYARNEKSSGKPRTVRVIASNFTRGIG